ncbi:MAG: GGDEF domain-containing protein [Lachnospirales bacterium]
MYSNKYDEQTTANFFSIACFMVVNFFWNCIYSVTYGIKGIYEMVIVTIILAISYLICTILVLFKTKIFLSQHLFIFTICFYVIASSYFLGYDKYAVVVLLPLLFAISTFFTWNKGEKKIWYLVIFSTYMSVIYLRYNSTPKYYDTLQYIESINIIIAITSLIYIIAVKTSSEKFISLYRNTYLKDLKVQIDTDFLTGIYNRHYFERFFASLENFSNSYIVVVDIDNFKGINDTYGHIVGDYILRDFAKSMSEFFRDSDRVIRWGGEEFLIYVANISADDIFIKLNNFREEIAKKDFEYDDLKINFTITLGVKNIEPAVHIDALIDDADSALYYGKNNGKNMVVVFESNMKNI